MLYNYKHIKNDFTKIHEFIEHLVLNVWCKPYGVYSINLLHVDFIPIVKGLKNKNLLQLPIEQVYNIFKNIYNNDIANFEKLKKGFITNNAIENLCNGKGTPLVYSQIELIDINLRVKLEKFFKDLYTQVPKNKAFSQVCGNVKAYYNQFLDFNNAEICPFCGINDIMTSRLTKRDAFDHYLPKDIYPFNSVNPDNLAPICKTCNSSYKLAKSPIEKNGLNRKAFFPFAKSITKIEIDAIFNCLRIDKIKPKEITLTIKNNNSQEKVDTWKELFGIEERYIDKFCSKEARYWRIQLMDELKNCSKTKSKRFNEKLKLFDNNRLAEKNFLKIPYFKACKQIGKI